MMGGTRVGDAWDERRARVGSAGAGGARAMGRGRRGTRAGHGELVRAFPPVRGHFSWAIMQIGRCARATVG